MYLLIKPFHHGQGHGLAQIVPAERHHEHVSLGFPFPGGNLALFYHGHVTLVVKEDHLESGIYILLLSPHQVVGIVSDFY